MADTECLLFNRPTGSLESNRSDCRGRIGLQLLLLIACVLPPGGCTNVQSTGGDSGSRSSSGSHSRQLHFLSHLFGTDTDATLLQTGPIFASSRAQSPACLAAAHVLIERSLNGTVVQADLTLSRLVRRLPAALCSGASSAGVRSAYQTELEQLLARLAQSEATVAAAAAATAATTGSRMQVLHEAPPQAADKLASRYRQVAAYRNAQSITPTRSLLWELADALQMPGTSAGQAAGHAGSNLGSGDHDTGYVAASSKNEGSTDVRHESVTASLSSSPPAAMSEFLAEATHYLSSGGQVLSCAHSINRAQHFPQPDGTRYAVAINLHDSDTVLPHMIVHLMQLVLLLPATSAYISIYESGSTDSTAALLELLKMLLLPLRLPFSIVSDRTTVRGAKEERIHFLAKMRNMALQPVLDMHRTGSFRADKLLFINDVFFCAADVLRLAQYKQADMACGMDFHTPAPPPGRFLDPSHVVRSTQIADAFAQLRAAILAAVPSSPPPALLSADRTTRRDGSSSSLRGTFRSSRANDDGVYSERATGSGASADQFVGSGTRSFVERSTVRAHLVSRDGQNSGSSSLSSQRESESKSVAATYERDSHRDSRRSGNVDGSSTLAGVGTWAAGLADPGKDSGSSRSWVSESSSGGSSRSSSGANSGNGRSNHFAIVSRSVDLAMNMGSAFRRVQPNLQQSLWTQLYCNGSSCGSSIPGRGRRNKGQRASKLPRGHARSMKRAQLPLQLDAVGFAVPANHGSGAGWSQEPELQHLARQLLHKGIDHSFNYADLKLLFYDGWVSQDIAGGKLANVAPYSSDPITAQRLHLGLPTRVYCCWNGMALLDIAPFVPSASSPGLKFRSKLRGECSASECSLLCDDLHRLNYSRVVMDPGVRVGYALQQAQRVYSEQVDNVTVLPWSQAAPHASLVFTAQPVVDYQHVECCDLKPGKSMVNFKRDCHRVDMTTQSNFTARFMRVVATG